MELSQERPPLALIACSDDWMSRALESVFQQHGYVVAHTRSGVQTLELARLANHDLLVLDESLIDVKAVDVCRAIRDGAQFDHSVPVVITSPTPVDPRARMAAFGAGTFPMMLAISLSGKLVPFSLRLKLQKAIPVSVFILATLLILRGLSLGIPYVSPVLAADGSMSCCHK